MTTKFVGVAMEGNKKIRVTVQELVREYQESVDGTVSRWEDRNTYDLDPREYQGMAELMCSGRRLIVEEDGDFLS